MGEHQEDSDAAAPPPPGHNKVELVVGGHSVTIESAEPLVDVISYTLGIFEKTRAAADENVFGFDTTGGQFERAEPYLEPDTTESWEAHGGRLGGQHPQDGATRRLVIPDPPGNHRARLGPVQMDPGRASVPRIGY